MLRLDVWGWDWIADARVQDLSAEVKGTGQKGVWEVNRLAQKIKEIEVSCGRYSRVLFADDGCTGRVKRRHLWRAQWGREPSIGCHDRRSETGRSILWHGRWQRRGEEGGVIVTARVHLILYKENYSTNLLPASIRPFVIQKTFAVKCTSTMSGSKYPLVGSWAFWEFVQISLA